MCERERVYIVCVGSPTEMDPSISASESCEFLQSRRDLSDSAIQGAWPRRRVLMASSLLLAGDTLLPSFSYPGGGKERRSDSRFLLKCREPSRPASERLESSKARSPSSSATSPKLVWGSWEMAQWV